MKTILITGASRGIGKALAHKYLAEGHTVVGTSLKKVEDFQHEHLAFYTLDLSSPASIMSCIQSLEKSGVHFDIVHNNAGVLLDDEETTLIPDKLRATLEVNLIGTADFTERILPLLNSPAHIIFTSSAAGSIEATIRVADSHYPYHYPAYKISKASLNMYARTLAVRLSHENKNVIVSSVHPGWVKTDMGGDEAPMTPDEAAEHIYALAVSQPPTGKFWFKGEEYPW